MSLGEFELADGYTVKDSKVSIVPTNGEQKDYNFVLSFDESKYLGIEGNDLKFEGSGEIAHGDNILNFEVEGPVSVFRFSYDVKSNASGQGYEADFKSFDFAVDTAGIKIKASGEAATAIESKTEDMKKWIHDELTRMVNLIKDDTMSGAIQHVQKLPLLNLTPLVTLYKLVSLAEGF